MKLRRRTWRRCAAHLWGFETNRTSPPHIFIVVFIISNRLIEIVDPSALQAMYIAFLEESIFTVEATPLLLGNAEGILAQRTGRHLLDSMLRPTLLQMYKKPPGSQLVGRFSYSLCRAFPAGRFVLAPAPQHRPLIQTLRQTHKQPSIKPHSASQRTFNPLPSSTVSQ